MIHFMLFIWYICLYTTQKLYDKEKILLILHAYVLQFTLNLQFIPPSMSIGYYTIWYRTFEQQKNNSKMKTQFRLELILFACLSHRLFHCVQRNITSKKKVAKNLFFLRLLFKPVPFFFFLTCIQCMEY